MAETERLLRRAKAVQALSMASASLVGIGFLALAKL
jgi:hypothetical protein